jgi:CubicO group peptidase (beta-lactamase class C family)
MPLSKWDEYADRLSQLHILDRDGLRECIFFNWREVAEYEWPGFGGRGPAFELARFYESLLGFGPSVLRAETVEKLTASCQGRRYDETTRTSINWGLGFMSDLEYFGLGSHATRAYGHFGIGSSFCVAVPQWGLAVVCIGNVIAPGVHVLRARALVKTLVAELQAHGIVS